MPITYEELTEVYRRVQQMRQELEDEQLTIIVHPDRYDITDLALRQLEAEAAMKAIPFVRPHLHANGMLEPEQALLFRAKKFNDFIGGI